MQPSRFPSFVIHWHELPEKERTRVVSAARLLLRLEDHRTPQARRTAHAYRLVLAKFDQEAAQPLEELFYELEWLLLASLVVFEQIAAGGSCAVHPHEPLKLLPVRPGRKYRWDACAQKARRERDRQ